jgi:hypothetical protein
VKGVDRLRREQSTGLTEKGGAILGPGARLIRKGDRVARHMLLTHSVPTAGTGRPGLAIAETQAAIGLVDEVEAGRMGITLTSLRRVPNR